MIPSDKLLSVALSQLSMDWFRGGTKASEMSLLHRPSPKSYVLV